MTRGCCEEGLQPGPPAHPAQKGEQGQPRGSCPWESAVPQGEPRQGRLSPAAATKPRGECPAPPVPAGPSGLLCGVLSALSTTQSPRPWPLLQPVLRLLQSTSLCVTRVLLDGGTGTVPAGPLPAWQSCSRSTLPLSHVYP